MQLFTIGFVAGIFFFLAVLHRAELANAARRLRDWYRSVRK